MSSKHNAIRLYSSSSDEAEEKKPHVAMVLTEVFGCPLYVSQVPNTFDHAASDEDASSEEEEKKSRPPTPRDRPQEDAIESDTSTVPTRAQRREIQHQTKLKNTPWPSRLSRKKRYQARRAPIRYGNTVLHTHSAPDAEQPQDTPRRHVGL